LEAKWYQKTANEKKNIGTKLAKTLPNISIRLIETRNQGKATPSRKKRKPMKMKFTSNIRISAMDKVEIDWKRLNKLRDKSERIFWLDIGKPPFPGLEDSIAIVHGGPESPTNDYIRKGSTNVMVREGTRRSDHQMGGTNTKGYEWNPYMKRMTPGILR
jgi:hypothetical protein